MKSNVGKGFKKRPRTKEELVKAYNEHSLQFAHKARLVCNLQDEMELHMAAMKKASSEAAQLPPEPEAPIPAEIQKEEIKEESHAQA